MQEKEPPDTNVHAAEPPVKPAGAGAGSQPFSEHVRELRQRLLYSVAALFLGSIAGYALHGRLFNIIRRPLNEQLYYTTPIGGFNAVIKISILFGIIVAVPVFVYQLGKFLSPAFRRRTGIVRIVFFSSILAALGVLFAYFLALPAALRFLANIDGENLQALITVNEYINFVGAYLVGFALLFQLPLILLFINRIKPLNPGGLMRAQRWVILSSFIVAAILTPTPDPVNLLIMTTPIIALYQFAIVLVWYVNRQKKSATREKNGVVEPAPAVPSPAGYSASVYSAPTSFPSTSPLAPAAPPAWEPRLIAIEPPPMAKDSFPSPAPSPVPQVPSSIPVREPRLIMDIFAAPQTPAT